MGLWEVKRGETLRREKMENQKVKPGYAATKWCGRFQLRQRSLRGDK